MLWLEPDSSFCNCYIFTARHSSLENTHWSNLESTVAKIPAFCASVGLRESVTKQKCWCESFLLSFWGVIEILSPMLSQVICCWEVCWWKWCRKASMSGLLKGTINQIWSFFHLFTFPAEALLLSSTPNAFTITGTRVHPSPEKNSCSTQTPRRVCVVSTGKEWWSGGGMICGGSRPPSPFSASKPHRFAPESGAVWPRFVYFFMCSPHVPAAAERVWQKAHARHFPLVTMFVLSLWLEIQPQLFAWYSNFRYTWIWLKNALSKAPQG